MAPPNTSATGGYLLPSTPLPADDDELDAILQSVVVGVTGLPGTLVFPRWQNPPPPRPEIDINWCAIGVSDEVPDDSPYIFHTGASGNTPGFDTLVDHEEIDVLASFYGPNAGAYAKLMRHGLQILQNTEVLAANQIRPVRCGSVITVNALINQKWTKRKDITIRLRRKVSRSYAIQDLASAQIDLFDDSGAVNAVITVPPGIPWLP